MGVSGCGKSTVGAALALALGLDFIEGDALHSPGNVALMAAGIPLTDADRAGWLGVIADRLAQAHSVAVSTSTRHNWQSLTGSLVKGLSP